MVPGQPSASGGSSGAQAALGFAASSAHRDRVISHRAALADLPGAWHPDIVAGSICKTRIFSEGIFTISEMACTGSHPRRLGFPRHDGLVDRAKISPFDPASDAGVQPKAIRRELDCFYWHLDRDVSVGPDRARDDDLSILCGGTNPARPRCRLAGPASRRWRGGGGWSHSKK